MPAIPIISAASSIGTTVSGYNQQKDQEKAMKDAQRSMLTYDQAYSQAKDATAPVYNQNIQQSLGSLDNSAISRGVYGQIPTDAFKRNTAAQLESDKYGAIANLAGQMQGNSQNQASLLMNNAMNQARLSQQERLQSAPYTGYQSVVSSPWDLLSQISKQGQDAYNTYQTNNWYKNWSNRNSQYTWDDPSSYGNN